MSAKQQVVTRGIGFAGMLTLVFVAAKLWDRIDWSWWWVCSPLWIEVGSVLGIVVALMLFAGLLWTVATVAERIIRNIRRLRGPRSNGL